MTEADTVFDRDRSVAAFRAGFMPMIRRSAKGFSNGPEISIQIKNYIVGGNL